MKGQSVKKEVIKYMMVQKGGVLKGRKWKALCVKIIDLHHWNIWMVLGKGKHERGGKERGKKDGKENSIT